MLPSNRPPIFTSEPKRLVFLDSNAAARDLVTQGEIFYTRHTGTPNVKSASFFYDGTAIRLADQQPIGSTPRADGIVINPQNDDLLIVGGGDTISTLSRSTGDVISSPLSQQAFHLEVVDASTIYSTDGPGNMQRFDISPDGTLSAPTTIAITGDDTLVRQLISTPDGFFYTTDRNNGIGSFGRLVFTSATTAATERLFANLTGVHSGFFDPYSATVILGGQSTVNQFDLQGNLISTRDFAGVDGVTPGLDNGTIDGLGHLFFASASTGHMLFLDYSDSGLIGDANAFAALPFLESGLDDIAPLSSQESVNREATATYVYDATAADPDGDFLVYDLIDDSGAPAPAGMSIQRATGQILWTPTPDQIGNHLVKVKVSDGRGGTTIQEYVLCVHPDPENHAPTIVSTPITAVTVELAASETENDRFFVTPGVIGFQVNTTFDWTIRQADFNNELGLYEIDDDLGTVNGVAPGEPGYATVALSTDNSQIIFRSGLGQGAQETLTLVAGQRYATYIIQNSTTEAFRQSNSSNSTTGRPTAFFSYTEANPDDFDHLRATKQTNGPTVFAWEDTFGGGDRDFTDVVFTISSEIVLGKNSEFQYQVAAIDFDNDQLTYSLVEAPSGTTIDTDSGLIEFNLGVSQQSYPVIVSVSDGRGGLDEQSFTIDVSDPGSGLIEGITFDDRDGNGIRDQQPDVEPGLAGRTIYLDENNNRIRDTGERIAITDAQGAYAFRGLVDGTYTVREEIRPGRIQTSPSTGFHTATVSSASPPLSFDFGDSEFAPSDGAFRFDSTPVTIAEIGVLFQYRAEATNEGGGQTVYDLPAGPAGMTIHPTLGTLVWQPRVEDVGAHRVVLRAKDSFGNVALQPFEITVGANNELPLFVSQPPTAISAGFAFDYQAHAMDPDGDDGAIVYRLADVAPAGMTVDATSGVVSWTVPTGVSGTVSATLIAADELGGDTSQQLQLQVVAGANQPPEFTSIPRLKLTPNVPWIYMPEAVDADGETVTLSIVSGPPGIIQEGGLIGWTPTQTGSQHVVIQATDTRGAITEQRFDLSIFATFENSPPEIVSQPPSAVTFDTRFAYQPRAVDPDGDFVMWSIENPPRGLVMDEMTGAIHWVPDETQLGPVELNVIATDIYGAATRHTFTVDVGCTNGTPNINSTPITNASVGEPYSYQASAGDPENDSLEFLLVSRPDAMTIDATTGLIAWTPPTGSAGMRPIEVAVRDSHENVVTQAYTIDVADERSDAEKNQLPRIVSQPVFSALPNSVYRYTVRATDPEGAALVYAIEAGPSGMTIDATSGAINWLAGAAASVPETVRVSATDPLGGRAIQTYFLSIEANTPPQIISSPVITVPAGAEYRYDVRVSDAQADRIDYSVTGPAGMTIDRMGRIRWQTDTADVGASPAVTITVFDEHGASDSETFTVNVTADRTAPTATLQFPGSSVSESGSVRVDQNGQVVFQVVATDNVGVIDLRLEIDGQNVPLNAAGIGFYTATTIGSLQVVALATDAANNVGRASGAITVRNPNDTDGPIVTINPLPPDISTVVEIVGSIQDANLDFWKVEYSSADRVNRNDLTAGGEHWIEIGRGTTNQSNEVLATFDPTVLSNKTYTIRVLAFDDVHIGGGILDVNVVGGTKIGNFRLNFTDLQIPLAGIPIEVTRTYDTLDSEIDGDFGFGWTIAGQDPRLFETTPEGQEFIAGKTKVYLTNPDGQRIGFTYTETFLRGGLLGDLEYRISLEPDPGVYDTLTIERQTIGQGGLSGAFGSIGKAVSNGPLVNPSVYTLTTKDGLRYRYDQFDGLKTITDLNGNVVTFTEDGISHSSGASIEFIRDSADRLDEIRFPAVDALGNVTTGVIDYEYNALGELETFTNVAGETSTYTYLSDPAHYLERSSTNGQLDFTVIYEEDPATRVFRFVRVEDVNGNALQTAQQPDFERKMAVVLDANGNATTFHFDDRGNVLREIDPLGNETIRKYENARTPDLETEIIDRRGFVTQRDYDSRGNLTEIRETGHQDNPFAEPVVTQFSYDAGNRVTSITNANQQTTWFDYDSQGNLTKIVNALGDSATFTYDAQGRRETFTDFNGNTTAFSYEAGDQPSRVTFADGTYQLFAYNQYGQVFAEQYYESDETLVEQKYTWYDNLGRPTHEFDGEFTDTKWNSVRKFYDTNGNLDWEIIVNPQSTTETGGRDGVFNRLIADLDGTKEQLIAAAQSRITDYEYDDRDQLIRQIDAEGGVVEFRYDNEGNRILLQDPVGNITTWVYDALNRVSEERDPFYNEAFTVDQAIANLSQPSGASCETNTRAIHVTLSCYDEEGNLDKEIDRNGRRREFDYDSAGRLLTEAWFNTDGSFERTLAFTYDVLGNMLTANDPDSNYVFAYDVLNRLTSVDNAGTPGAPNVILAYDYDKQGNVIRTQDNAGVTVESEYDKRNRLAVRKWFDADVPTGETPDVDPARVDMLYNAAGRMTEMLRFADLNALNQIGNTTRTYDLSGRSDTIRHADATDALIASYDYDYDFAGLLDFETRQHQDNQFSQTIDYDYDLTGQLTAADYSKQADEFYRYDANGNRTESYLHGTDYVTDTANQLKSDGDFDYEYDGEGNLILKTKLSTDADGNTGEVTTYDYDHHNRLVNVTRKSAGGVIISEVSYTYDALNRRIARTANGETIHFVYNGAIVWTDFNQSGEAVARYLFGNRVDRIIASFRAAGGSWHLTDLIGTVRDVADASIGVQNVAYSAFGQVLQLSNSDRHQRFSFTSREYDVLTESYFYRARYYSPDTGVFLQVDPLRFDGGDTNLHRYVLNRPTTLRDPFGESVLAEYSGIMVRGLEIAALSTLGAVVGVEFGTIAICAINPRFEGVLEFVRTVREIYTAPIEFAFGIVIQQAIEIDSFFELTGLTCQTIHDTVQNLLREFAEGNRALRNR